MFAFGSTYNNIYNLAIPIRGWCANIYFKIKSYVLMCFKNY